MEPKEQRDKPHTKGENQSRHLHIPHYVYAIQILGGGKLNLMAELIDRIKSF